MQGTTKTEGGSEWRRVQLWFNGYVIADSTVGAELAGRLVAYYGHRFAKLRVTVETTVPPEQ